MGHLLFPGTRKAPLAGLFDYTAATEEIFRSTGGALSAGISDREKAPHCKKESTLFRCRQTWIEHHKSTPPGMAKPGKPASTELTWNHRTVYRFVKELKTKRVALQEAGAIDCLRCKVNKGGGCDFLKYLKRGGDFDYASRRLVHSPKPGWAVMQGQGNISPSK